MTLIIISGVLFVLLAFAVGLLVGRWSVWRDNEAGQRTLANVLRAKEAYERHRSRVLNTPFP